jgi:class 3 adenylate cyclase
MALNRKLLTVLFTDIVGSTQKAVELGDSRWQELLDKHHRLVRQKLEKFKGHEIDTAGDGFFATFDQPADAVRCASAVSQAVGEFGIQIRSGLHLGECEVTPEAVRGVTVHIGARVASKANAGEVLVSSTLKEAIAGSEIRFKDRGAHVLKGIPGKWNLFAVKP